MRSTTDRPHLTCSTYATFSSELNVTCPTCNGFASVTADKETAYLKCTNCGHTREKDRTVYRYDVHNECKHCGRYYRVDIQDEDKQHFQALHVACPFCKTEMSGKVRKNAERYTYVGEIRDGKDPYFGLNLWFLTHFHGKPVWTLNREHLAYLIEYISADLRDTPFTVTGKSQTDRLPTFMKSAKNRKRIVKLLRRLI